MKFITLLYLIFTSIAAMSACPDFSKMETAEDCPWAEITRQIVDQNKSCEKMLKEKIPFILTQLKKDKKSKDYLSLLVFNGIF